MFTPEERGQLRAELLERARRDPTITAAALTGSAASGREDEWSDIDLAFAVTGDDALPEWTKYMYEQHAAIHHVDVHAGAWLYRVFLLANTLQVDLAFAPAAEFRALAPSFRLVFGTACEPRHAPEPSTEWLIGFGWWYALHARSSIQRGKLWQAEYMVSGLRDQTLALACVRHAVPAVHAKGIDDLPPAVVQPFEQTLARELTRPELARSFRAAVELFVREIRLASPKLEAPLAPALEELASIPSA